MRFSIVIPLYNKAPYIFRAINSVLQQTYQDFEIIVVDDGSTDGGGEIVKNISDPRVQIIFQKNTGVSAARNLGTQKATSDLIAFLDADDEWKPEFLTEISNLYTKFPDCGAYATYFEVIKEGGAVSYPPLYGIAPDSWQGILPNLFQVLQKCLPFTSSSIAIPKTVLINLGGFPVGVKRGEDKILWIKIALDYQFAYSSSNQSIYHLESTNRACNLIPMCIESETDQQKFIQHILSNRIINDKFKQDLINYYSKDLLYSAKVAIVSGCPELSYPLLKKAKRSRKFLYAWLFWTICSIIPKRLFFILNNIRNKTYQKFG